MKTASLRSSGAAFIPTPRLGSDYGVLSIELPTL